MNNSAVRRLDIIIDGETHSLAIEDELVNEAESMLNKMDQDMDAGWLLGRRFVDTPNTLQRCQIVGDRLLSALHVENQASVTLMAAYLVSRLPTLYTAVLDTEGEADQTLFYDLSGSVIG